MHRQQNPRLFRPLGGAQACAFTLVGVFAGSCATSGRNDPLSATALDKYDEAYLAARAKAVGCVENDTACCKVIIAQARSARTAGKADALAVAIQALALTCPAERSEAIALLRAEPRAPRDHAGGYPLSVAYRIALDPDDRLYWAGAFVNGEPLPASLPPERYVASFEFHVMTPDTDYQARLNVVRARTAIVVEPDIATQVELTLQRNSGGPAEGPFVVSWSIQRTTIQKEGVGNRNASGERSANEGSRRVVTLRQRLKSLGPARIPAEFRERTPTMLRVCIDKTGTVQSISFTATRHPRYNGSALDAFRGAKFHPYTIDGVPVPTCSLTILQYVARE